MAQTQRSRPILPLLALLIIGLVGADVVRRLIPDRKPDAPRPAADTTTMGGGTQPVLDTAAMSARRRARIRELIDDDSANSYLVPTIAAADSTVRRWPDDRINHPLHVAITRQSVDGFKEDFVANVAWAVGQWDGIIPVHLDTGADSASADIVVVWTRQLDSNRTGRTDLTWDRRGVIHHAVIVLATHSPDGRELNGARMSGLALHEIGHAIGLNHSPNRDDVLHPVAYATELSERDRRTARLLYQLPIGSIR
ncbi:MAG TPA: matrixin family metalloprotease [Gemmatimonadales bacterium]|jgi:predicted Zn-dependent protease